MSARQRVALASAQKRFAWRLGWDCLRTSVVAVEDIYGTTFLLYPWDRSSGSYWIHHPDGTNVFAAIEALIQPGDVVFDVGAHFGLYAVAFSRRCGQAGKVFAFEAVPDTWWRLRETLVLNRCENVTAVQAAVGDQPGTAVMNLFADPGASGWSTMGRPVMGHDRVVPTRSITVPAETIDNFCDRHGVEAVAFLKVDVEGFEKSVLLGANRMLTSGRVGTVCFEISDAPLKGAGITSGEVFSVLHDCGYLVYRFSEDRGIFVGPFEDADRPFENYFASRQDLTALGATNRSGRSPSGP